MQFASNPNVTDLKRGIIIDRLISDDSEEDLVRKLLDLYHETNSIEVKYKAVQGLMIYNQRHRNNQPFIKKDYPLLKTFFFELINSESLNASVVDDMLRGYIETHSSDEIMANRNKIDK